MVRKHSVFLIPLILLFFLSGLSASGQRSISITPVKSLPLIDGNPDDVIQLMTSYNFFQLEPVKGAPSQSETKILLMQSKDTLYIAVVSLQKSAVTGKIQLRDKFAESDDGIFLILGTFNDNRNAFLFWCKSSRNTGRFQGNG